MYGRKHRVSRRYGFVHFDLLLFAREISVISMLQGLYIFKCYIYNVVSVLNLERIAVLGNFVDAYLDEFIWCRVATYWS